MKLKTSLVLVLVMSCICTSFAQNLLKNPGFESDGGSGWVSTPADWWAYSSEEKQGGNRDGWAKQPSIGDNNGCAFYGWEDGAYAGCGQDVFVNLTNGNVFAFSINLLCETNFSSSGEELWMKLEMWTNGVVSTAYTNNIYTEAKAAALADTNWHTYTFTITNTDPNVYLIKPMIGAGGYQRLGDGSQQAIKFDNAVFLQSKVKSSENIFLEDDFEDGNMNKWTGVPASEWACSSTDPISGAYSLKQEKIGDDRQTDYVFAEPLTYNVNSETTTWRFNLKTDWEPSGSSYFQVWLMSDSSNLEAGANGYIVSVDQGSDTTSDRVELYRVADGAVDRTLLTATNVWKDGDTKGIEVTRSAEGTWELLVCDGGGFSDLTSTGTTDDTTFADGRYFGLFATVAKSYAGKLWLDDVLIKQANLSESAPLVDITDPAGRQKTVESTVTNYTFKGTASNAFGNMGWTNELSRKSGTFAVASSWQEGIDLHVGNNIIYITATNRTLGTTIFGADDAAAYSNPWNSGDNHGTGFQAWNIWADGQAGTFIGDSTACGDDVDINSSGGSAFLLWGNPEGGNYINVRRMFNYALEEGQGFDMDLGINSYSSGSRGIDILGLSENKLFNFNFYDNKIGWNNQYAGESGELFWSVSDKGFNYHLSLIMDTGTVVEVILRRSDGEMFTRKVDMGMAPGGIKLYCGGTSGGDANDYFVNNLELSYAQARPWVSIIRERGDMPSITITNPVSEEISVNDDVDRYPVGGTCNSNAVGSIRWQNSRTGESGTLAVAANWVIGSGVRLDTGANTITLSVTNSKGYSADTMVTITRKPPPPTFAVTVPPKDITVLNQISKYTLSGTSAYADQLDWTNALTGGSGVIPSSGVWGLTNVALGEGDNYFIMTVTNSRGYEEIAWDRASESVYSAGWTNGMNAGTGLSAWQLSADTNATYTIGTDAYGKDAWGLSALNGAVAEATRSFGTPLVKGDEVVIPLTFPSVSNSAGVVFQNGEGEDVLAFFARNNICYVRHNSGVDEVTKVPFATNGMEVSFVFNTVSSYVARTVSRGGTVAAFKGNLMNPPAGKQEIVSVKLWYYYEETSGEKTFYVNSLERRQFIARDYVMITRESSNMPSVIVTNPIQSVTMVDNDISNYTFSGTCNAATVGNLTWENKLTTPGSGTFPASADWTQKLELAVGTNVITFTGTNNVGTNRTATVTVVREEGGIYTEYPQITITYPLPGEHVIYDVLLTNVLGTANDKVNEFVYVLNINQTNLPVECSATNVNWAATNQVLDVGTNGFYVYALNSSPVLWAEDEADNAGYDFGGWVTGSNEGKGMKAWDIDISGDASNCIANGGSLLGMKAWALYADTGAVVTATRMFDTRLRQGDQFYVACMHDELAIGGKGGFALVNTAGQKLMELFCQCGETVYMVSDASGYRATQIPVNNAVALRLNIHKDNSYVLWLMSDSGENDFVGGTLKNPLYGTFTANGVEFWNSGGGEDNIVAFDNLEVLGGLDAAYTYIVRDPYPQRPLWINELHYANDGPDINEGVEVAGVAGEPVSSYELIWYVNGNDSENVPLTAYSAVPNQQNGYGAVWIPFDAIPNDPSNGFALVYMGGTYTQLVNYVTWGTEVLATSGPASGVTSDFVGNEMVGTPIDASLQLVGMGTNYQAFSWYGPSTASRGRLNAGQYLSLATNVTGTIPDSWWNQYFHEGDGESATTDKDSDGYTNEEEFLAGTDPTNPDSYPEFSSITQAGDAATIVFPATPQHNYTVWWSTNLMNTNAWTVFTNMQASGYSITVKVTNSWTNAFFRMDAGLPGW